MAEYLPDTNVGNTNYIRKTDVVNAVPKERIVEYMDEFGAGYNSCRNNMLRSIESLESTDVVPIVRCRNCKHHIYDEIFSCYWCECPGRVRKTAPDGFCEKGEE